VTSYGLTLLQGELLRPLEKMLAVYPDLSWSLSNEDLPHEIDTQIELCLEIQSLLDVICKAKGNAITNTSSHHTKELTSIVRTICDKMAHGHKFSFEDADRAFGAMLNLLQKLFGRKSPSLEQEHCYLLYEQFQAYTQNGMDENFKFLPGQLPANISTVLRVDNLSYKIRDQGLYQIFHPYGEVLLAKVVTESESKRSKGFGFVEMATVDEVRKAASAIDAANHHGRTLKIRLIVDESYELSEGNSQAPDSKACSSPQSAALKGSVETPLSAYPYRLTRKRKALNIEPPLPPQGAALKAPVETLTPLSAYPNRLTRKRKTPRSIS
jgi:RNA recognition motif. (a.k.a. RRM, RBD, or RNP domain)